MSRWLRFKQALGLAAPDDGLCTWKWDQQEVTIRNDSVTYLTNYFKCVLPWGHGPDHDARHYEPARRSARD